MAKKFLASLFIFVSLLLSSISVSYAQEEAWNPSDDADAFTNYRAAIEDDNCMTPSLECLVHQVFRFSALEFVNSTLYPEFSPQIGNDGAVENDEDVEVEGSINNPTPVGYSGNNILFGAGKLIGNMYAYPAANTSIYVADIMNSAHITPKAYAQGLGFTSLNPILELWKVFRNLAYMFFVILFIIIGFMIMFRQKVGGQAAVTAQQAIPGVIVSLILVTFSYAIAGLLIDFMYLIMFLIIGVFGETLPIGTPNLIDLNIRQLSGILFVGSDNPGEHKDLVSNLLGSLVGDHALDSAMGVIGGLTLTVVLSIAILIGTVKLFFELLKSYASIVLSVVTSPMVLMMGAIPGKSPIGPWLKDLIGNLLPFPTVLLVLVVFFQFKSTSMGDNLGGFMPPFLLARGQAGAITSLMGLAIILALPEIVKDAKKGLVKEGFGSMIFKAATESAKQGWKGGEIIPGMAASAPGKYGVSGQNMASTTASGISGVGGGVVKSLANWRNPKTTPAVFAQGFEDSARTVGSKTKNPWIKEKEEEKK